MSTIEFDDTAFKTSLATALSKMKLSSDSEAEALAYAISNGAKQLCPVRTGRLRSSIGVQPGQDENGKYFDVGTYVVYAARIEWGFMGEDSLGRDYQQPAHPYMRPAILSATEDWKPRITP